MGPFAVLRFSRAGCPSAVAVAGSSGADGRPRSRLTGDRTSAISAGGYPFAILLMAVVCVSLYVIFKKRDWL